MSRFFACTEGENPRYSRSQLSLNGYPGGEGFPKLEILYNTDQQHQAIAELLRKQWQRNLGITASLRAVMQPLKCRLLSASPVTEFVAIASSIIGTITRAKSLSSRSKCSMSFVTRLAFSMDRPRHCVAT